MLVRRNRGLSKLTSPARTENVHAIESTYTKLDLCRKHPIALSLPIRRYLGKKFAKNKEAKGVVRVDFKRDTC